MHDVRKQTCTRPMLITNPSYLRLFSFLFVPKEGASPNLSEKIKSRKIRYRPERPTSILLPFQSGEGRRRRRRRRKQFLPTTSNNTSSHASPPPPLFISAAGGRGRRRRSPPINNNEWGKGPVVARNWRSPVSSPRCFDGLLTCPNARASVCNLTINRYVRMRKQIATKICCRDIGSS